MSKVAARQPCGRPRIISAVFSNVPQCMGKLSELILAFTDFTSGCLHGYDRSCIMQKVSVFGLGTSPSSDMQKGPMTASSS
jgi:hypothetical protein